MLEMPTLEENNVEEIENPREWLEKTGRFKPIVDPSGDEINVGKQDIRDHYETIRENVPESDRWMLEALRDYVTAPILEDKFSSEDERNTWHASELLNKEGRSGVKALFESNKLRGNSISGVMGVEAMAVSEGMLDPDLDSEVMEDYKDLYEKYAGPDGPPSGYDAMSIEEKIAFVKKISNLAKDLYLAIAWRYMPEPLTDQN